MSLNNRVTSYMSDTLNLDSDNREIVAYSLELIFHSAATVLLVLLMAWLIGSVKEAVILLIVMFLFKNLTGGAHCSSAARCTILSILLIPSFARLSLIAGKHFAFDALSFLTILCILFSFAMVYKLAPSASLPIVSARHRQNRRNLTFLLLGLIMIMQITLLTLIPAKTASFVVAIDISIFWQTFMLTKQGDALVNLFDKLLLYFMGKGGDKNEKH